MKRFEMTFLASIASIVLSSTSMAQEPTRLGLDVVPVLRPAGAPGLPAGEIAGQPTYSVHNMIGEQDALGQITCYRTTDAAFPGEPDDIVTFDGLAQNLATDLLGTVASVIESQSTNPNGTFTTTISVSSPTQTDLFPGGFVSPETQAPLRDLCWFIGIDDALDMTPAPTIVSAAITFTQDGTTVGGPFNVTDFFTAPWDGFFGVGLGNFAGSNVNGVVLEFTASGSVPCGDGTCGGTETCETCPADCGVCSGACPGSGNCCSENGSPGCTNSSCCDTVCAEDPFCCDTEWDSICADEAAILCCDMCAASCPIDCPGEGDCCQVHAALGCSDEACCSAVCAVDPFCCSNGWDAFCVGAAAQVCGGLCPVGACCLDTGCDVPGSCESVILCGPNCACFEVAEGGGHCASGSACVDLSPCPNGTSDCPAGQLCYINTCCGESVCAPDCDGGSDRSAELDRGKKMFRGDTLAAQRGSATSCIENAEGFCTAVGGEFYGETMLCSDAGVCSCPPAPAQLIDTSCVCNDSLSRVGRNVLRFYFDAPITEPASGELEIRELLPDGAFGADDLSPLFRMSLEGDRVLRVEEHGCFDGTCDFASGSAACLDGPDAGKPCGQALANETWYVVMNRGGWCVVADFALDFVVLRGDANNDHVTSFTDLSAINAMFSEPADTPDDSRFDINTVGGVSFTDLSAANAFIGSSAIDTKPDRHDCTLP